MAARRAAGALYTLRSSSEDDGRRLREVELDVCSIMEDKSRQNGIVTPILCLQRLKYGVFRSL
jgi:hypothetical protein